MIQPANLISRHEQHKVCFASVLWRQPKGRTRAQFCASRRSLSHASRAASVGAAPRRGNNGHDSCVCSTVHSAQDESWCRDRRRASPRCHGCGCGSRWGIHEIMVTDTPTRSLPSQISKDG
eukprot:6087084-Pleurochrysis_carterae.AAC.1